MPKIQNYAFSFLGRGMGGAWAGHGKGIGMTWIFVVRHFLFKSPHFMAWAWHGRGIVMEWWWYAQNSKLCIFIFRAGHGRGTGGAW